MSMSSALVTLPLQLACQLIGPVIQNVSTDLPTGYTVFPELGLAYKYYGTFGTWNQARKQCMADGANLLIADSREKISTIMAWSGAIGKGQHNGVHKCFDKTEWTSVKDGQPVKFVPWKTDANLSDVNCCTAHFHDGSGVGPYDCNEKLPFICEISMASESRFVGKPIKTLRAV